MNFHVLSLHDFGPRKSRVSLGGVVCAFGLAFSTAVFGGTQNYSVPGVVTGDADGDVSSPWQSDGVTPLVLEFDTSGEIPAGTMIQSVTLSFDGIAIDPSYRSEPILKLIAPDGVSDTISFRYDLFFPNSPGAFSVPLRQSTVTGNASGVFRVEFTEDWDDDGVDCEITNLTLSVTTAASDLAFSDRSDLFPQNNRWSGKAMGVIDMNQDGLDDIVYLHNGKNLNIGYQGAHEEQFSRLALGTVSGVVQWGIAIGDANRDGFPDIASGGLNDGVHYFQSINSGASYTGSDLLDPLITSRGMNFADVDGDGWLDLFVNSKEGRSPVFRNTQNGNLVSDDTLLDVGDDGGNSGSVWTDYDNDGDLDLYVSKHWFAAPSSSDPRRINQLFRNDNGTYVEVGAAAGLALGYQTWASEFGDIDNDGDLDCFVGNHGGASRLYKNNGDGTFSNVTPASGITTNWDVIQCVFRDFNNDGWLDLLLTGEDHEIWLNDGDGTFTREDPFTGYTIHSCAVGDLNHDGFTDIFAGYAIGYNTPSEWDKMWFAAPNGNGFLSVTLEGVQSDRHGSGARLELHGPWGVQVREVRSGESSGVTHSATQIFGMGEVAMADKLVVRWPSGLVEEITDVQANQFMKFQEGTTQEPPVLTYPGYQSSSRGEVVSVQLVASDPTNDPLTYSAQNLPDGLQVDPATGEISGTVANDALSSTAVVSVTDGWYTITTSFPWSIVVPGDTTPPTVSLAGPAGVINGPTTVLIETSEPVVGFTVDDLYLSNAVASDFLGSGSSYRVTLTPIDDGVVTAIVPDDLLFDLSGNGSVVSNQLSFQSNVSVPAPTLLATVPSASGPFVVSVTFSEPVVGLDQFDFTITNGFATGIAGSGSSYALFVTPVAGGDIQISLAANRAADAYGNGNGASNFINVTNELALPGGSASEGLDDDDEVEEDSTGVVVTEPVAPQLITQSVSADSMKVAWQSEVNESYAVEYSTDLSTWSEHSTHLGSGAMQSAHLDLGALGHPGKFFVRLRQELAE